MIFNDKLYLESSNEIGINYANYVHLFTIIPEFLQVIENSIIEFNKNEEYVKVDLSDTIKKFKEDIELKNDPIEIIDSSKVREYKSTLKNAKNTANDYLLKIKKIKHMLAHGDNWITSCLFKPHAYADKVDADNYEIINHNINAFNYALDWSEKVIINLYNYIDQDINIVTIIKSIYFDKHMFEDVGDADDNKPEGDHPIKDIFTDLDRKLQTSKQKSKKTMQDINNVKKAMYKPIKRINQSVENTIFNFKNMDENKIKAKLANPRERSSLWALVKTAVAGGSLLKAGLLLNPIFLGIACTKLATKGKRDFRLRNELISEVRAEIEIIEEKIQDADHDGKQKEKYQLMRYKNELKKKLIRAEGGKKMAKII